MDNAKLISTFLANHFRLSTNQCPKTDDEAKDMSKVPYASAVGCLMYAMVCTRPNLVQVVSVVSKFLSNPGILHWDVVKWTFRYFRGTTDYDIMFNKQQSDPSIEGYMDADYTEDLDDKRSTMGYVFTFGGGLICWKFMIQSLVALSTIESEYMAVAEVAKESLSLTGLVKELGIQQGGVQLYCDSQSVIYLAKN